MPVKAPAESGKLIPTDIAALGGAGCSEGSAGLASVGCMLPTSELKEELLMRDSWVKKGQKAALESPQQTALLPQSPGADAVAIAVAA